MAHIDQRVAEGVENAVVLLREIRALGYAGSYSTLKGYVQPRRQHRPPRATMRFETAPGEQAQVDWGVFRYRTTGSATRSVWAFVAVLSWSRAMYVEFVERADVATFLRCHIHAFAHFGGVPRRCLYDNAKVVVLGRDAHDRPDWNPRFLDFTLRLGFDAQLCRPYRAQTKGRVESGIKYLRHNFWPTVTFTDLEDLNRQAQSWLAGVADVRVHGTTCVRPLDRLMEERPRLQTLPPPETLTVFDRVDRTVGRDGFVCWERSYYGVPWRWAGATVQVAARDGVVEIWAGVERLAVHARATQPGQRFTVPGQWTGLPKGGRRPREPLAVQLPMVDVQRRPLSVYDTLVAGAAR